MKSLKNNRNQNSSYVKKMAILKQIKISKVVNTLFEKNITLDNYAMRFN